MDQNNETNSRIEAADLGAETMNRRLKASEAKIATPFGTHQSISMARQ
jgi:hypothetical protein